ncbi:MAG: hypothetical protein ABIO70_07455 [Pseudomonadota bacterium]
MAGPTLWGGGGGEKDLVLAHAGRALLFPDLAAMWAPVRAAEPCNMACLDGYQRLAAALDPPPDVNPLHHPLTDILRWMSAPRWRWSPTRCATVLNGINLLWDLASTLERDDLRARLRPSAPLGSVSNVLTFADREALRAGLLTGLPRREATTDLEHLLTELLPGDGPR